MIGPIFHNLPYFTSLTSKITAATPQQRCFAISQCHDCARAGYCTLIWVWEPRYGKCRGGRCFNLWRMSPSLPWCIYFLLFVGLCSAHPHFSSPVMLPRKNKNSTNVTPSPALPPRTSGSFGDKRPLSLVTNQQPFRADTAEMQETESPQSETPATPPPFPLRPAALSPLPSGVSGLRRKTTRLNTYDTFAPALEEHVPPPLSQPPNVMMSMPSPPFPQVPGRPPPTPVRPQQHAPGGGIGGFVGGSSSRQGPNRDNPHHNTTDYTYRFDTLPSFRSDSGPPQYESANVTGGVHAKVWPTYNKISQDFDKKMLEKWNSDLDVLLIFVSLVVGGDHQLPSD